MPDIIEIGEPVATQRETSVRLVDAAGNGVSGVTGATVKVAKPGGVFATDVGCTLTEITGAIDPGTYRLRLSADAVSLDGEVEYEISASNIVTAHGFVTVAPLRDALHYGLAQGGTAGSVTLAASASSTDNYYAGNGHNCVASIIAGTGAGQARLGTAYSGTTKYLTVAPNWAIAPDATSVVRLLPFHAQLDASVLTAAAVAVWGLSRTGNQITGTFGEYIDSKVSDAVRQIQAATPLVVPTGALLEIVQGDLEEPLAITLVDLTGTPVDVSDATGPLVLHWQKPDGTVTDVDLTNVALNLGQVKYVFASGDTDIVGGHKAQVIVPRAGGPQTFPMNGSHFRWTVHAQL